MFIGISQRILKAPNYDEMREVLSIEWGEFFACEFKEFLPLPLCVKMPLNRYLGELKGVILSGGNDLARFNKNAENLLRDEFENKLIKMCVKHEIPILAICRGAQFLADFYGAKIESCENHVGEHFVKDKNGREFLVNSFHNFKITNLGAECEILVLAKDKSVEAFKHKNLPFFAAMWHFERKNGLENKEILNAFKKAALEFKIKKQPISAK